ncbi:MAG: hypothetical protein J6O51_03825 [Bacteroidales bacterium]|nr:hypothetical protein [Bacteroidales bacterium]
MHSRETESGLKVSTQFFYVENAALATYQSSAAQVATANSYGGINTGQVFLQPSVSGMAGAGGSVNVNQGGPSSNDNDNVNDNQGGNTGGGNITGGDTGGGDNGGGDNTGGGGDGGYTD